MEVKIIVPKFPNGIAIGEERENLAVPVVVDYTAWIEQHGTGALQILLQRPQDADPYPVAVTNDNGEAVWTPSETDMNFKGRGEIQLVYTAGDVIERSPVIMVISGRSLVTAGDPPEPYEDWLERLLTIAAEAQQSAIDASGSAEAAGTSADLAAAAKTAAETAQTGAEAAKSGAEAAETAARQSAALAGEKAAQAAQSAQTAAQKATDAQQSAEDAQTASTAARLAADAAETFADNAEAAADEANQAKTDAQSAASAAAGSAADAAATVTEVETKGAEQIAAINQAGTTQIAAVDAAGAAQVQAIEDKGEEVIESIPSDYTELVDEVSDLKSSLNDPRTGLAQKAGLLRDTAEGAVASFVPDASVENLLGLEVKIEPVQDLHGYENPWPAGGGANIFDAQTWVELGTNRKFYSVSADETITVNRNDGSSIEDRLFDVEPGETYSFLSTFSSACRIFSSNSQTISQRVSGTFTAPDDGKIAVKFYASAYPASGKFILVKGSTVPSAWSPYSNLCPISGWDAVGIDAAGANLVDPETIITGAFVRAGNTSDSSPLGSITSYPSWSCSDYIRVKPLTQYTTTLPKYAAASAAGLVFFDKYKNALSGVPTARQGSTVYTFTTPADCSYVRFSWDNENGNEAQIAVGSESSYHPYAGNTYTIQLGETVYGGTLDVTNGVLTVTYAEYVFTGNEAWQASSTPNRFFVNNMNQYLPYNMAAQPMVANAKQNVISSIFGTFAYKNADGVGYIVTGSNELKQLVVNTTAATTVADINTIMTGSQLAYEIATPIVIDLDPVTIATIANQTNNVWADAGGVSVEFAADLKTYIDNKIAAAVAALS